MLWCNTYHSFEKASTSHWVGHGFATGAVRARGSVCVCVSTHVCVCVWRERVCVCVRVERESVCVCVCVCARRSSVRGFRSCSRIIWFSSGLRHALKSRTEPNDSRTRFEAPN